VPADKTCGALFASRFCLPSLPASPPEYSMEFFHALAKLADASSYEKLPFYVHLIGFTLIFLVLTKIRIWFDLAEADVVVSDQLAVRKSLLNRFVNSAPSASVCWRVCGDLDGCAARAGHRSLRLERSRPSASIWGAFLISQLILLLLLAARFWQRAGSVSCLLRSRG